MSQITPTSGLVRAASTPTETAPARTTRNQRKASASDLSGLCIPEVLPEARENQARRTKTPGDRPLLEDVDRQEHDDPHDVHEVPVDPGHLDAQVILRVLAEV